ncbi:TetR/AcrR family transcriptional regulator [Tsukamurella sp. 8F]|uniref:TetR/AcrR family transcriptional regulator n=1 Tax=unclassified Tsukamurella TaxID=2633480 RepID=UPI0023B951F0|nr:MULTISPECIES: TetR/AcrR family transcriptional regulator [unclassified Tsukamurella]MDF0531730.1 TetR/AcrR family transcriptional regulator [Tsukamurella sp. 8J]MDF0588976.1 TetR/AcrR family transcriptional regulator [Tsukamurella sp. 8F]
MSAKSNAAPDRRRLLIAAARDLFGTRSYDKVTTTEIANTAGVAYGLIAHHFGNKRGLYLAAMDDIRSEIDASQDEPVPGDTLEEQLHNALRRHVAYIDEHRTGYIALMRGALGADPDMRSRLDELRWGGATRILQRIGVTGEPSPVLRAAMRGWVAMLDELMLDRLDNADTSIESVVQLAADALISTLRTAHAMGPVVVSDPDALDMIVDPGGPP